MKIEDEPSNPRHIITVWGWDINGKPKAEKLALPGKGTRMVSGIIYPQSERRVMTSEGNGRSDPAGYAAESVGSMNMKGIARRWLVNSLGIIFLILVVVVGVLSYVIRGSIYSSIQATLDGVPASSPMCFPVTEGVLYRFIQWLVIMWKISLIKKKWN